MTLAELVDELKIIVLDPAADHQLVRWINESREELAAEYELPALRLDQPVSGTVTTANWLYDLPSSYQKNVFRARNSNPTGHWFRPIYRRIAAIDEHDFDHNETGMFVERLAVEGEHFAVWPKANDTIYLWYYQKPTPLVGDDDVPEEIPAAFHAKVILPSVVLRAFRAYPELARENVGENEKALNLWRRKRHESLYGSHQTGEIGLLNYILKSRMPRVHGGRQPLP